MPTYVLASPVEFVSAAAMIRASALEYAGQYPGNPFPGPVDFWPLLEKFVDANWDDLPQYIADLNEEVKEGVQQALSGSDSIRGRVDLATVSSGATTVSYWDLMAEYKAKLAALMHAKLEA